MLKKRMLKMMLFTIMAFVLSITPAVSANMNISVKAANTKVAKSENSYVRVCTNYMNFTITSSSGKNAVIECGTKVKGDLAITEADVFTDPGTSVFAFFYVGVTDKDETFSIIPSKERSGNEGISYYTGLLNGEVYAVSVESKTNVALTVDEKGNLITQTEDGEAAEQKIVSCGENEDITTIVTGTDNEFSINTAQGETKITSKNETKVAVELYNYDECQKFSLGEVTVNQKGITVLADKDDYVIKDMEGTEVARAIVEYGVSFDDEELYYVPKGGLVLEPQKPEIDGYTFEGWYANNEKWDFNTNMVYSSVELYSKWTKKTLPQVKSVTVKNKSKNNTNIKWKKVKGAKGYEVKYSTSKKFTAKTTKKVKVKNKLSKKLTKLKKGKTYYIKIRAYAKDGKATVYGKYSITKKIKIKK